MIVTLLTDFGTRDPYVASMKGVLLRLAPAARVVDITHEVPPFDTEAAAYALECAAWHFPRRTVHVAVVDPGVGTSRRILAAEQDGHRFLAPDNGVLDFLHDARWREVLPEPGAAPTFHGRDVFAPAAAKLANDARLDDLGPPAEKQATTRDAGARTTRVVHVDRFGTLICAARVKDLPPFRTVIVEGKDVGPLRKTFGDVPEGHPVAYEGSSGRLEIAVNRGRADERLHAGRGARVEVS